MSMLLTERAAVVPTTHGISCFVCRQPTELVASCASCPLALEVGRVLANQVHVELQQTWLALLAPCPVPDRVGKRTRNGR